MKYNEIFRLKEMLEKAEIPFEMKECFPEIKPLSGYQIGYPVLPPDNRCVCDAIEHGGSYGQEKDLLEIMGLLTDDELEYDSVKGYLTAEDVFNRIKTHYESLKGSD